MKDGTELAGDEAGADMQQRSAHENPVIFYSMVIGFFGRSTFPLLILVLVDSTLSGVSVKTARL